EQVDDLEDVLLRQIEIPGDLRHLDELPTRPGAMDEDPNSVACLLRQSHLGQTGSSSCVRGRAYLRPTERQGFFTNAFKIPLQAISSRLGLRCTCDTRALDQGDAADCQEPGPERPNVRRPLGRFEHCHNLVSRL